MHIDPNELGKKRAESYYYGFITGLIVTLILSLLLFVGYNPTDIEVYTPENIYYINGLQVTNENNNEVLNFEDNESLKTYISRKTADDTNPYK